MIHRVRQAMQTEASRRLVEGDVEVDETFIGGHARNMHRSTLAKTRGSICDSLHRGRNQNIGKVAVMGLLDRHGEVRTVVVPNVKRKTLEAHVKTFVEPGSVVYSDGLKSYGNLRMNMFTTS